MTRRTLTDAQRATMLRALAAYPASVRADSHGERVTLAIYAHAFAGAEHDERTRDQMEAAFGAVLGGGR